MRILKTEQYINEKLDIRPVTRTQLKELPQKVNKLTKKRNLLESFIKKNNLVYNPKTDRYDSKEHIWVKNNNLVDGHFPIKFGVIDGNFICSDTRIKSLDGAPTEVGGFFDCKRCNKLESLVGCPTIVKKDFSCNDCTKLKSLDGAPKYVVGEFDCSSTPITSLKGIPQKIGGGIICSNTKINTLEFLPKIFDELLNCDGCVKLISLEGIPKNIKIVSVRGCNSLTSLEGLPMEMSRVDCSYCQSLKSLKGSPIKVEDFFCNNCKNLETLDGAPQTVSGLFRMDECINIKTLKGSPQYVGGNFDFFHCCLETFDGAPQYIGGNFRGSCYYDYKDIKSIDGLGTIKGRVYIGNGDRYKEAFKSKYGITIST